MDKLKPFKLKNYKFYPLGRNFYKRHCLEVSRDLLGKLFVKKDSGKLLVGKIVEVEAYDGAIDEASHSFVGITNRNKVMFYEGGFLYVYFTYGVHHCANVVTGENGEGQAVLIRAIQPLIGVEMMAKNRFGKVNPDKYDFVNLANGPGKVCKAFGIDLSYNGLDLCGKKVFISENFMNESFDIISTKRIGITKSKDLNWRFLIKDNRFVSRTVK